MKGLQNLIKNLTTKKRDWRTDKRKSDNLQTMSITRTKAEVTKQWSNIEPKRRFHRDLCLWFVLCIVSAPQNPHLITGEKRGSVNCNLQPQHVVSQELHSASCSSTRTCKCNNSLVNISNAFTSNTDGKMKIARHCFDDSVSTIVDQKKKHKR